MYYLELDDVILTCNYTVINMLKDDTVATSMASVNTSNYEVTITYPTGSTYSQLPSYFRLKSKTAIDAEINIPDGRYELLCSVWINGFELARSAATINKTFNQFLMADNLDIINNMYMASDSINILLRTDMSIEQYTAMINASGLLYVIATANPMLSTCYGIILERARLINVRSKALQIITDNHILIEEADYITALILKLRERYPEVQFYNIDQDINDTKYNEFVKYKAFSGSYERSPLTTVLMSDPIYGSIIRTTCKVDFEYHTNDIVRFNARKLDFQQNKFLSGITTCKLKFPTTNRELMYNVHWDRAKLIGDSEYKKGTTMNNDRKWQYSFNSNAQLTVTIYRLASSYHIIKRIMLKEEDNLQRSFAYDGESWVQQK